jgi:hypothetical protein
MSSAPDFEGFTVAKGNLRCMTRRIEHRSTYEWPAARVYDALIDADYLKERLRVLSGNNELVDHAATTDGARFQVRQGVRAEAMPALARTVAGGDMVINRSEVWRREREGHYTGEVAAEVPGMPCLISGSLWLRDQVSPEKPPDDRSSELVVEGSVRVSVPLVGGKLENLVAEEVRNLLAEEARFTSDWLSRQS